MSPETTGPSGGPDRQSLADRVDEVWGSADGVWRTPEWLHWMQHPRVQQRLNFLASGSPLHNRFQFLADKFFRDPQGRTRTVDVSLTLGCGHGELERGLPTLDLARRYEGVDISEGAIREAVRLAEAAGLANVSYSVADLNSIVLKRRAYDVIFGISSIHHVSELERLFAQVRRALKPGGLFVLDEYVGPTRFQWTEAQTRAINEAVARIPAKYSRSLVDGVPKGPMVCLSPEQVAAYDPTEAVRSAEILPLLERDFEIVENKGVGGALLHWVLEGIAGNFSPDDPEAMAVLDDLFEMEDRLTADGTLQHDFCFVVARPRPSLLEQLLGALGLNRPIPPR